MCILFVEDEAVITLLMTAALQDVGREVLTAENAEIALGYLMGISGRFSCLVTDVSMPGELTGMDVANWARGIYPAMPIILTTALGHAIPRPWLQRQQVILIDKPYMPSQLVSTVEALFDRPLID